MILKHYSKSDNNCSWLFLLSVFTMTKILMMTTEGYPFKSDFAHEIMFPRFIGVLSFFLGVVSLTTIIALSGWTKSKKMGIFTTIVGVLTLVLILITMT